MALVDPEAPSINTKQTVTSSLKSNPSHSLWTKYVNEVKGRALNFPAGLVVFYAMAVDFSMDVGFNIAFAMATNPEGQSCYFPSPQSSSVAATQVPIFIQNILFFVAFPIMGWLADTKIGRRKAVNLSLWLSWFGTLFQMISYCIQYSTCGMSVNIAKYGISGVALLLIVLGNAGFYANMLSFGLDQLPEASTSQVRGFVHWLVWGMFVGFFTDYLAFLPETIYDPVFLLISAIIIFTIVTIANCINILLQDTFEYESSTPLRQNPYKTVYEVMKYAYRHKVPAQRSALTYWENELPSRIDLGKAKYGGPFDDEQPEDVKTFWRIVAIFASFFGFYIPYYVIVNGIFQFIDQMEGATTSFNGYGALVIYKVFDQQGFLLVPLLELVILPLFPKLDYFLLNPLKGLNAVYIFLFVGLCCIFTIDTVGHIVTTQYLTCFDTSATISLPYTLYTIPLFFTGLADFFSYIYALEFICCQAPINMGGMLLGVFWFVRAFYLNIGALLQLPTSIPGVDIPAPGKLTCTFWILLIQVSICGVGVVVNLLVSRRYKRRKRGEDYHVTSVVTQYYDKILNAKERCSVNEIVSISAFDIEDSSVAPLDNN